MLSGCEVCGTTKNLDRHHIVPKRMGGRKNPAIHDQENLMTLCRQCHGNVHQGQWEVVRSPNGLWVLDKHTGEQVMRRLSNPSLDVPSIFQLLNTAEEYLSTISECLPSDYRHTGPGRNSQQGIDCPVRMPLYE